MTEYSLRRIPNIWIPNKTFIVTRCDTTFIRKYVKHQIEKADDISDVIEKFNEFTCIEQSYNFLCNPESNIELAEEAMKMYGSMKYEEIFRFLNKEYCISNHFYIPNASDDDD